MFDLSKLGVSKNIPKVNFTDYTGLFIAPPKFGKSTTASKFPNAIIVPFEEGTKGLVANVVDNINDFGDFVDFVDKLEEHREEIGDSVQTIVFDTVNKAYDLCEAYTIQKMAIADKKPYRKVKDIPHGQFWSERDKVFGHEIDRIVKMGFSILFLSHLKIKKVNPKDGEPYDEYSSTMVERLEAIVNPLVDFILYGERKVMTDDFGNKVKKRVLITRANEMASQSGQRVYVEDDIMFDTEEEAMEKYQEVFKEAIMKKLESEGVTDSFEKISKQQKEEKDAKVKEYIQKEKEAKNVSPETLHTEILAIASKLTGDLKKKAGAYFQETLGDMNPKKCVDVELLKQALDYVKSI